MLGSGAHIQRDQVQAILELGAVVSQLSEEHGPVNLLIAGQRGGFQLFETLNKLTFVIVASLKGLRAHVSPLVVARAVSVLEPSLRILFEYPLPVLVDNGRERRF